MRKVYSILFVLLVGAGMTVHAKERFEMLPYGDMESWVTRYIKESKFFSGKTKTIYAIASTDTTYTTTPFPYGKNGNPWSISNAYASVLGWIKVSGTTRPERRGKGWCCRMDCRLEDVVAMGIDLKLQIAGTIFLGKTYEPVPLRAANDPYSVVEMGVPYTRRPKAIQLDYKAKVEDSNIVTYAKATAHPKKREGRDCAEVYAFLQHRWEENGKLYAERIATAYERIWNDVPEWQNAHRVPFRYGDISKQSNYHDYEGLNYHGFRAKNSKGDMVTVNEVGYSTTAKPTHLVLMISSGCYEAFIGHDGNIFWVDNVGLIYDE
ncbi:MAG: PCMD domain-containing protein [Paludibacteraceae bacterium]|nr:PCMD domain-containing protein [Paludibacteraceae bacterium]